MKTKELMVNKLLRGAVFTFALTAGLLAQRTAAQAEPEIREAAVKTLSAGNIIIGVEGKDTTSAMQDMIDEVNKVRYEACKSGDPDPRDPSRKLTEADYVPIKIGVNCTKAATIRAAEAAVDMQHGRPNGTSCSTVIEYYYPTLSGWRAENLAWHYNAGTQMGGWIEERDAYLGLASGQTGHYETLIDPTYKYMGVAVFNPTNDCAPYDWGCTAGSYTENDTEVSSLEAAKNLTVIQKMEVPVTAVTESAITGADALRVSDTRQLQAQVSVSFSGVRSNTVTSCPVYGGVTWTSADPSVISITSSGVMTANAVGEAVITATLATGSDAKTVSRKFVVIGSDDAIASVSNPAMITVETTKEPTLPKTVTATLSSGLTMDVDVTWDSYDKTQLKTYFQSKEFSITGKAAGFDVTQKIHVNAATVKKIYTEPATITTTIGVEPEYPLAFIAMSNGLTYLNLKVDWDEQSKKYYLDEKGGEFTIRGTTSYGFPTDSGTKHFEVTAKLIVKTKESEQSGSGSGGSGNAGGSDGSGGSGNTGGSENAGGSGNTGGSDSSQPAKIGEVVQEDGTDYTVTAEDTVSFTAPADTKVTSVTIPATVTVGGKVMKVTEIGSGAFSKCKKLKTVTIGKNVTRIAKNAFKGCKKIKTVKVKSKKLKKVGNGAFKNLAKKACIYLPKSKKSKYKKLFTKKVIGNAKLKWT